MADAPTPKAPEAPAKVQREFKVLDVRDNDVTLELEDGRVIAATLDESIKLDDLKRNTVVAIKHDGLDRSDAPKDAVVTRIIPKAD